LRLEKLMPRLLLLLVVTLCSATAAQAQDWPNKPIRFVVSQAAGGTPDILCRLVTERVSRRLGQQIVVENRPGGANSIAAQAVARSAPDGYTLLWASTNVIAIVPATGKVPYDPVKDFAPVSALGTSPQVLLAHGKLPVKSVAELVSWVKHSRARSHMAAAAGRAAPAI
jgi:tripartite-type tricarboxylate transporter receptor subunit TctC